MKTKTDVPAADVQLPPELLDAARQAREALSRRARLDDQVNHLADEIAAREIEVDSLGAALERAESEAAVALCDDDEAREQQLADEVRTQLDSASVALDRMRRRIQALEANAASFDDAVATARVTFEAEQRAFARDLFARFGQELDEALAPARGVISRIRALAPLGVGLNFLHTAFVPDVQANVALLADLDGLRRGYRNLLAARDDEPQPVEFAALLAPLLATQRALRTHQPYVPLRLRIDRRTMAGTQHSVTLEGSRADRPAAPPEIPKPDGGFETPGRRAPSAPLDGRGIMQRWASEDS